MTFPPSLWCTNSQKSDFRTAFLNYVRIHCVGFNFQSKSAVANDNISHLCRYVHKFDPSRNGRQVHAFDIGNLLLLVSGFAFLQLRVFMCVFLPSEFQGGPRPPGCEL